MRTHDHLHSVLVSVPAATHKEHRLKVIVGVEGCPPHRVRHTFDTKLVMKGMDTMLARQLTRHKSESSFARYSKRALELKAHQQFYQVFGEEGLE